VVKKNAKNTNNPWSDPLKVLKIHPIKLFVGFTLIMPIGISRANATAWATY